MFQLFTDTDTDITPEVAAEYGYKLISMPYAETEGADVYPYEDFKIFDYHTFYERLRGGVLPKTYALSPARYIEYFEPTLREGKDILYVHFSAAMSGTFNSMRLALETDFITPSESILMIGRIPTKPPITAASPLTRPLRLKNFKSSA